jgi:hypothetical protein
VARRNYPLDRLFASLLCPSRAVRHLIYLSNQLTANYLRYLRILVPGSRPPTRFQIPWGTYLSSSKPTKITALVPRHTQPKSPYQYAEDGPPVSIPPRPPRPPSPQYQSVSSSSAPPRHGRRAGGPYCKDVFLSKANTKQLGLGAHHDVHG